MNASPVKRRVLGALDPNAPSPKVRRDQKPESQQSPIKASLSTTTAPARTASRTPEVESPSRKRPLAAPSTTPHADIDSGEEPASKRPCLGEDAEAQRIECDNVARTVRILLFFSHERSTNDGPQQQFPRSPLQSSPTRGTRKHRSPSIASTASISVFDTSAAANDTTLTEPDLHANPAPVTATATAPPPRPTTITAPQRRSPAPRLTRDQAREKAEILRLRLGLASYKVRTGQTDVPLERLQAGGDGRNLAADMWTERESGRERQRRQRQRQSQHGEEEGDVRDQGETQGSGASKRARDESAPGDAATLPRRRSAAGDCGGGDDASGGAASGLLSLARS
ncbi:hypothetical protein MFIFM68171_10946 [Madurella fahalii]|uniref:Cyclin-dependent kinase n=1 Tax=Madurella fahalii TaxID=1157608 RepID=A0ABQ0GSL5_9PEZI